MEQLLHALAAPRRRQILSLLASREHCAGEIHRTLGEVTFGAVSQHLRVLETAGLVRVRRQGRHRLYRAHGQALDPLREWLDAMWQGALEDLRQLAESETEPPEETP